ncbi:hypothetical protein DSBG_2932 [Desulfosporosinus sp. BG]|nr:hypothetical protein DSBG_2932 [Desulfosporosinus sp. BG]
MLMENTEYVAIRCLTQIGMRIPIWVRHLIWKMIELSKMEMKVFIDKYILKRYYFFVVNNRNCLKEGESG